MIKLSASEANDSERSLKTIQRKSFYTRKNVDEERREARRRVDNSQILKE